ncbi:hypothetical protein [Mycobacterium sp.]|nr:hypothetical protein [Mycobacterium sp.]
MRLARVESGPAAAACLADEPEPVFCCGCWNGVRVVADAEEAA